MTKPITIAQMLPSEAWERYVGVQTPAEFMRNARVSDPEITITDAAWTYVWDYDNRDTDELTGNDLNRLVRLLAKYIHAQLDYADPE